MLGEYPFKNRNIMNDSAAKISSKSKDGSEQARIPAPATDNIDTNHDFDAKKLAHAPPVYLESDQATSQLGNPGNHDLNAMTPEEKADAKTLAHAPPVYLESAQATSQLGNPGNHDLNAMTPEEKANAKTLAHAPPVYLESDQAKLGAFRLGDPDNGDVHLMASREDEHEQNLFHTIPPEPPESDRAKPGAFRVGSQDNDDGNTITHRKDASPDIFKVVSARLVEDDPEETIAVAVVHNKRYIYIEEDPEVDIVVAVLTKDERGNKKRLIYISIGVLVISVVVAIVLGVTLSPRSSPDPAPLQRDPIISLIQSRSASTSFSNTSYPQSQALD